MVFGRLVAHVNTWHSGSGLHQVETLNPFPADSLAIVLQRQYAICIHIHVITKENGYLHLSTLGVCKGGTGSTQLFNVVQC